MKKNHQIRHFVDALQASFLVLWSVCYRPFSQCRRTSRLRLRSRFHRMGNRSPCRQICFWTNPRPARLWIGSSGRLGSLRWTRLLLQPVLGCNCLDFLQLSNLLRHIGHKYLVFRDRLKHRMPLKFLGTWLVLLLDY